MRKECVHPPGNREIYPNDLDLPHQCPLVLISG
jgi:hypothetical protein